MVVDGRRCRCGSAGCLEAYVSAEAILERCGSPAVASAGGEESMLAELIAAADSSPAADAVLAKTAEYLGVGIGSLINLFNPERVILGGWAGLLLGGRLLPAIRESARRNSLRHLFAAASIELGRLGPEAVTFGAATLPMEDFLNGASRPPLRSRRAAPATQRPFESRFAGLFQDFVKWWDRSDRWLTGGLVVVAIGVAPRHPTTCGG